MREYENEDISSRKSLLPKIVHHWGKQKGLCWGSTSRSWKEVQNMLDSRIPYLKMLRAQFLWSRISIALCLISSSSISPFKSVWFDIVLHSLCLGHLTSLSSSIPISELSIVLSIWVILVAFLRHTSDYSGQTEFFSECFKNSFHFSNCILISHVLCGHIMFGDQRLFGFQCKVAIIDILERILKITLSLLLIIIIFFN